MSDDNEQPVAPEEQGATEEAESSQVSHNTTDSPTVQAQEEGAGEDLDSAGSDTVKSPESIEETDESSADCGELIQRLGQRMNHIEQYLIWKEDLMLKKVFEKLHLSYYERWGSEAKKSILLLANLKRRSTKPRAG